MLLKRFKVTNFRSVVDSGWIDAENVTALIGVNESGKTNLLLPLWKLNPAQEGEIIPTSDFPKATYASVRDNPGGYKFITAEFASDALAEEISELTGMPSDALKTIQVARYFDGDYEITFPEFIPTLNVDGKEVVASLSHARSQINNSTPLQKEGDLKDTILTCLDKLLAETKPKEELSASEINALVESLNESLPESPAATSTIVPQVRQLIDALTAQASTLESPYPDSIEGVHELVVENIPKFVFYSNYGNLDSEIYLPHVVDNLKREDLGAKEMAKARTLRVLFSFVRLQADEILELGRDFQSPQGQQPTSEQIAEIATKKRERTILLNSAGTDLTKRFRDWWKQGDYTFEFQADGDHFRIWVSDSKRPEKVELEDRSSGLQWFLSFYLIFLVESEGGHKNAILLLDEPGLSLHPLAQRDLSAFFDGLAETNQIIYTTHSPFLVEADALDRARKVFMSEDGSTKASADLRRGSDDPRKSGATYAIYSALNMNVAESILYGCHPVIVEGPSDQHYLTAIKTLLIGGSKISPRRELVFPPSHGANNAKVLSSILTGLDEELPTMLLDGDEAGRKMAKDLQNGAYQNDKSKIKLTDDYLPFQHSEIEDLFPTDFMSDVVDKWERSPDTPFGDVVKKGQPIVPQIKAWAEVHDVELDDGWKVDLSRQVKKRALKNGISKFDDETIELWTKIFEAF